MTRLVITLLVVATLLVAGILFSSKSRHHSVDTNASHKSELGENHSPRHSERQGFIAQ